MPVEGIGHHGPRLAERRVLSGGIELYVSCVGRAQEDGEETRVEEESVASSRGESAWG